MVPQQRELGFPSHQPGVELEVTAQDGRGIGLVAPLYKQQIALHLLGGAVAQRAVGGQQPMHHFAQPLGKIGYTAGQCGHGGAAGLHAQQWILALPRLLAGKDLVEQNAQGEQVGGGIQRAGGELLRRQIVERAGDPGTT